MSVTSASLGNSPTNSMEVRNPIAISSNGNVIITAKRDEYIYTSSDAGVTWTARNTEITRSWHSVAVSSDGTKMLAGSDGGSVQVLWYSADGGATWSNITPDGRGFQSFGSVAFDNANGKLYASDGGGLYVSTDAGVSWSSNVWGESTYVPYAMTISADGTKFVGATHAGVLVATVGSWGSFTNIFINYVSGLAVSADGQTIVMGAYNGDGIKYSTDGGVTLQNATGVPAGVISYGGVEVSSDGTKVAFLDNYNGNIYTSSDFANWTTTSVPTGKQYTLTGNSTLSKMYYGTSSNMVEVTAAFSGGGGGGGGGAVSAPNNTTVDASYNVTIADHHAPVVVNLRALVDASASVSVFGPSAETISNVVWCTNTLDVSALYVDSEHSLLEFWEPSDARGTLKAQIAGTRDAQARAQHFAVSLASVIQGEMDASAANPFQAYASRSYDKYTSFGELALAYAAEGMFGHPSATAAVTNDVEIVDGFNNDASKNTAITSAAAPAQGNQALAQRLAAALHASSEAVATAIAQVVLGQDASRATNEDNSERLVDQKAALRFYAGDVVYVAIKLTSFRAAIGAAVGTISQNYNTEIPTPADETYYLRITLA